MKRTILLILFAITFLAACVMTLPFISFGKSLKSVAVDAAQAYGIEDCEYTIEFVKSFEDDDIGENVYGYHYYEEIDGQMHHTIKIRKASSRPIVIGTIFHEFAHVAQVKYDLDFGNLTNEQHAEILSFSVMRANGYKWDSVHLLPIHMFAKPSEYRVSNQLWHIALTGSGAMSVAQYTQN